MPRELRLKFTDTITSWQMARNLASDESGRHRVLGEATPTFISREEYEADMLAVQQALTLLAKWQDQAWGAAKGVAVAATFIVTLIELWRSFHP